MCIKWHNFIEANKNTAKIDVQKLLFGNSYKII